MVHPIKKYREAEGLTQEELAEKLGVSRAMVGLVESGERQIDPTEVGRWAKVTGITREQLRPDIFGRAA
jgi:transcriptional regulator with XRE-family HTH domain